MTTVEFHDENKVKMWWAWTKVRAYRVTCEGATYTARCGAFTAHGATLATAVERRRIVLHGVLCGVSGTTDKKQRKPPK